MKIIVKSPMKRDEICALLDGHTFEGVGFQLTSRRGIDLTFEVTGADPDTATALIKSQIRATDYGKVLNFSVMPG